MLELQWDEGQKKLLYFLSQTENKALVSLKMMEYNQIPGILPMHQQYIDEQICFSYEVQGYDSLQQVLEQRTVSVKWICRILRQIIQIVLAGEAYFLNIEEYYISSECIFLDHRSQQVALCYLPGSGQDVYRDFRNLLEAMLEHMDHKDKKEVAFFYALYDMYSDKDVSLIELQEHLYRYQQEKQKDMGADNTDPTQESRQQHKREMAGQRVKTVEETAYYLTLYQQRNILRQEEDMGGVLPTKFVFEAGHFQVGRQQGQDLLLLPQQISRNHAELDADQTQVYLTDRGSVNGTFVNGRKLSAHVKTRLEIGDVITFADISYQLHSLQEEISAPSKRERNIRGNILRIPDTFRLKFPVSP